MPMINIWKTYRQNHKICTNMYNQNNKKYTDKITKFAIIASY